MARRATCNGTRRAMLALLIAAASSLASFAAGAGERAAVRFPVPAIPVTAGDTIADDMLTERELIANDAAVRTHHTQRAAIVGKVARRSLPAGMAIPLNALREIHLFKEGERVVMEFQSGGLSIRGTGIALQPGVAGQPARIRNLDTGVIVTGTVRADGSVEVGGG